jgi:hypothetical protein
MTAEKIFLKKIGPANGIAIATNRKLLEGQNKWIGSVDYQNYELRVSQEILIDSENLGFGSISLGVVGISNLFEGDKKIGSWMIQGNKTYPLNRPKTLKNYNEFLKRYNLQDESWGKF